MDLLELEELDKEIFVSLQYYLDQEIKKLCPIHGISFGNIDDKSTWIIHYEDKATEEQKIIAQELLNNFEWNDEIEKSQIKKQMIEDNKNNIHMKAQYVLWKEKNSDKNFEDFIDYVLSIEI